MKIIHWTIKYTWEDGEEEYLSDISDYIAQPIDNLLTSIEEERRDDEIHK